MRVTFIHWRRRGDLSVPRKVFSSLILLAFIVTNFPLSLIENVQVMLIGKQGFIHTTTSVTSALRSPGLQGRECQTSRLQIAQKSKCVTYNSSFLNL